MDNRHDFHRQSASLKETDLYTAAMSVKPRYVTSYLSFYLDPVCCVVCLVLRLAVVNQDVIRNRDLL